MREWMAVSARTAPEAGTTAFRNLCYRKAALRYWRDSNTRISRCREAHGQRGP
jgi:hypothetical protein